MLTASDTPNCRSTLTTVETTGQQEDDSPFMNLSKSARWLIAFLLSATPLLSQAAEIDGATLSAWWSVPFAGILLSIALCPLLLPSVWHHHYGKIAAGWALAFLLPFAALHGAVPAAQAFVHALAAEYLPFIVLLTALYTVAGGIYIRGNFHGSPGFNTVLMLIGAVLASFMGTTGASMLMVGR